MHSWIYAHGLKEGGYWGQGVEHMAVIGQVAGIDHRALTASSLGLAKHAKIPMVAAADASPWQGVTRQSDTMQY